MAELLIKAVDAPNYSGLLITNSAKAVRGCYRRGDVVEVRPDGASYGKAEGLPKFIRIKVPDRGLDLAKKYEQSEMNGETPVKRRLFTVDIDSMPPPFSGDVATGVAEMPWSALKGFIRNKVTNETE